MRVAQVIFHADAQDRDPEALFAAFRLIPECAEAAVREGAEVALIVATRSREARFFRNGVDVQFVADPLRALPFRLVERVAAFEPDVVHVHGLAYARQTIYLSLRIPRARLFGQDHNDKLPSSWRRPLMKASLHALAGVGFTAPELARPFQERGLLPRETPVFEILEASTPYSFGDREEARRMTGLFGDPCVLWVGHFDAQKDPVTAIEAIERALGELPGLELWCCYRTSPEMVRVSSLLARNPALAKRVHLLGARTPDELELLHRASDFFMLACRTEGGIVSIVDAFSCGSTPIVTDTVCYRHLTRNGLFGGLAPIGDAPALARTLVEWSSKERGELRHRSRRHFETALSYERQRKQLTNAYDSILKGRERCSLA